MTAVSMVATSEHRVSGNSPPISCLCQMAAFRKGFRTLGMTLRIFMYANVAWSRDFLRLLVNSCFLYFGSCLCVVRNCSKVLNIANLTSLQLENVLMCVGDT